MECKACDTLEGINNHLTTLNSFHQLLAARKQAAKGGVRLTEFVVMGRFRLDQNGQTYHFSDLIPKEIFPEIGVVTEALIVDSMMRNYAESAGKSIYDYRWSMGSDTYLPEADVPCKVCKQFWRLDNAHDCVTKQRRESVNANVFHELFIGRPVTELFAHIAKRRNASYWPGQSIRHPRFINKENGRPNLQGWKSLADLGGADYQLERGDKIEMIRLDYYHEACWKNELATRRYSEFDTLFQFAGFGNYDLQQLPDSEASEYRSFAGPWFEVLTDFGMIKIGNRKRVMVIDWSATKRKLAHAFRDSQNTGGEYSIHAYLGTSQPLEYLTRIRTELSKELVPA